MANFKYVNNDERVEILAEGSLVDILSNVCTLVHTLYERLPDETAQQFKREITDAFARGLPFKTADELAEEVQKITPEGLMAMLDKIKERMRSMKEDEEDA